MIGFPYPSGDNKDYNMMINEIITFIKVTSIISAVVLGILSKVYTVDIT